MLRSFRHALAALAITALSCVNWQEVTAAASGSSTDELCSLVPSSYAAAKSQYSEAASAIAELEKHAIAMWYSDRNGDYSSTLEQLVSHCKEDKRLSVVVYGLPNKDCDAGYSSGGTVKTTEDYIAFLQQLVRTVGSRKALYVLEPDAVGLLAKPGSCGEHLGYRENLKAAVKHLSPNANAEIYLDIGYWTLQSAESLERVVAVVKELAAVGPIKGVAINTSNYRSSAEMDTLCRSFQQAMGSTTYKCIVDTSRNFVAPKSTEWCNVRGAGIGHPPTADTGFSSLAYFLWVKPPGESDGECTGGDHTADAMKGPGAGAFFPEAFKLLWDQGYFVQTLGQSPIGGGRIPNNSTTPTPTTTSMPSTTPTTTPPTPTPTSVPATTPTPLTPTKTSVPTTTPSTPNPTTSNPTTQSLVQTPKPTKKKCSVRRAKRT